MSVVANDDPFEKSKYSGLLYYHGLKFGTKGMLMVGAPCKGFGG